MLILLFILLLFGLCLIFLLRCRKGKDMSQFKKVRFAHRGLHNKEKGIPENSLTAFKNAIDMGYGAELDVHLTKDHHLVVLHDSNIQRMCGKEGQIEEMTLSEIQSCRLLDTHEKIPLLEEVLTLFIGKTPLIIELKPIASNRAQLASATTNLVDQFDVTYCMESFDPFVIKWLKEHRPDIIRGQLSDNFLKERGTLSFFEAFALTNLLTNFLAKPDFIAYEHHYRHRFFNQFCQLLYHPYKVSWTIHSEGEMLENEKEGCLVIFEGFRPHSNH